MNALTNLCFGDGYFMEYGKEVLFSFSASTQWKISIVTQVEIVRTS